MTAYNSIWIRFVLVMALVLVWASPSWALDTRTNQVLVEPKIVEVVSEELLYNTVSGRDSSADIAMLIKSLPDRSTVVEASVVGYGRGADFRRIDIQRPQLIADGDRIQPIDIEKIYVQKSSVASPIAPILFGIIGSQYEGPGSRAASTPGQVCPVTGQQLSDGSHGGGRGDIARSIDKAGMAAGMGLLTSQAKGELEGYKIRWELPATVGFDNFKLNFDTFNKNTKKTEPLSLAIAYDPDAIAKKVQTVKYLPIRFNASVESGPVVTEQQFTVSPYRLRQFKISIENILRGQGEDANVWVPKSSQIEYAASDYWDDFEHEWDDFDEDGYCHECGHYEPEADEYNYDKDGKYLGDTRIIPDRLTKILIDPEQSESYIKGAVTGEKAIFITDYPVTKALFKTQAFNKRTNELLIITTPVIIRPTEASE